VIGALRGKCLPLTKAITAPYRTISDTALVKERSTDGGRGNMVLLFTKQKLALDGYRPFSVTDKAFTDNFAPVELLQQMCLG
jgi:hypothetical protein